MPKDFEQSETGNWNVADKWSELMIFKPLNETSEYLKIAYFGCSDLLEDFMFDEQTKINTKIKGLKWAKYCLEQAMRNSLFAIKTPKDKKKIEDYLKDIGKIDKIIEGISDKKTFGDKVKIEINNEAFEFVYGCLIKIFTEVTEPMNKNDLIFIHREEFDPHKFKENIKERFKEGE
jgi:hypothetical protein